MDPVEQMKAKFPTLLRDLGIISSVAAITGPILYSLTVRKRAWRMSLACARFLRWDIPGTDELSIIPPYHVTLIFRSFISGFCLLLLWQGANLAFSAYVAQEPLKRGQPLTQDSNDPNGSLINGLKSRKSLVKTFAFWELAQITRSFPARRISVFRDIDRPTGPAWSQISSECLKMIQGVNTRIAEHSNPSTKQQASIKPEQLQSLPRIGMPPKEEPVFMSSPPPSSRREMVESKVGAFAKSYGNSSPPSPIVQQAKQHLEKARTKFLTPKQQQATSPARIQSLANSYLTRIQSQANSYLIRFLHSPWAGAPFRQTFARRIRSIAFGQPFSELVTIIDAIDALTNMATASIKEDDYGKVAKSVPSILRTFSMTYQNLERLTGTLQPHWTDVGFEEGQRQVEDVNVTLGALRHGLRELVDAFGGFAADIGLEEKDVRAAKAIAGKSETQMIEK
ncbi:MAG: hypothetical protein LQ338_004283 [Usnochroma carphineum]|nr:MAG: hypothetical protein LQ338_004283 [Usnochroma carphineum]